MGTTDSSPATLCATCYERKDRHPHARCNRFRRMTYEVLSPPPPYPSNARFRCVGCQVEGTAADLSAIPCDADYVHPMTAHQMEYGGGHDPYLCDGSCAGLAGCPNRRL